MPTRDEVEYARHLATRCVVEAEELRRLWESGLEWPGLRLAAERLFPLLAEAKLAIEPLEQAYPAGCPTLPGLARVASLNGYALHAGRAPERHATGHMQALEVLMGIVVRVDRGGLVEQSPVPRYDRAVAVVIELPEGFADLRGWIGREAESLLTARSPPSPVA